METCERISRDLGLDRSFGSNINAKTIHDSLYMRKRGPERGATHVEVGIRWDLMTLDGQAGRLDGNVASKVSAKIKQ